MGAAFRFGSHSNIFFLTCFQTHSNEMIQRLFFDSTVSVPAVCGRIDDIFHPHAIPKRFLCRFAFGFAFILKCCFFTASMRLYSNKIVQHTNYDCRSSIGLYIHTRRYYTISYVTLLYNCVIVGFSYFGVCDFSMPFVVE